MLKLHCKKHTHVNLPLVRTVNFSQQTDGERLRGVLRQAVLEIEAPDRRFG
jgi:hypothetical protein